jgi:tetratricopeptide (TPR) repeat protein
MRFSYFPAAVVLSLLSLTAILPSCGREPAPEERQADSTLVLAKSALNNGSYREGMRLLHVAASLDLRLNRPFQLADEYSLLGRVNALIANFDSAITNYGNAIDQYKSLAERNSARTLLLEIASLRRQMGDERASYTLYIDALRLARVFNDTDGIREIQFAMLSTCRSLDKAEEHAQIVNELLKASAESGKKKDEARAHYESAMEFVTQNQYQQGVEPLLRALTLADQTKDSLFVIQILASLADTYNRIGNLQQSFETYTDALTRSDRTAGAQYLRLEMLTQVGTIYIRHEQFTEAGRFYRAALSAAVSLKNTLAEGFLFAQLGYCELGVGNTGDALKSLQSAVDVFSPTGYEAGMAYVHMCLGILFRHMGQPNNAVEYFKKAVTEKEHCFAPLPDPFAECEKVSLGNLSYYDPLIELLFQLGNNEEAFSFAARRSEHILATELDGLELRTRDNSTDTCVFRYQHARGLLLGAERQLANILTRGPGGKVVVEEIAEQKRNAEKSMAEAARQVVERNSRLGPTVQFHGVSISEVQRLLPQGTVLIRYVPTARSLYMFAISNSTSSLHLSAIDRDQLRNAIGEYNNTLSQLEALADSPAVQRKPLERQLQNSSAQLYAAFVRPLEVPLEGAGNVLVVRDRDLSDVPVHALRKGFMESGYCIERFPVNYIPSLADLEYPTRMQNPINDVVALGHPGETQWDVEYELRDIRAFYKEMRLHFGDEASLSTLQHERGDLLHLALDLRFSPTKPGNANVLLSDGIMRGTTRQISWGEFLSTAPFPAVVISNLHADSTSSSQLLPQIFLANGSSSVILNSLPISRKAKKYFGEMFYTTLLAGKPVNAAYRQALLEMIKSKDYSSPENWAPFGLWGK